MKTTLGRKCNENSKLITKSNDGIKSGEKKPLKQPKIRLENTVKRSAGALGCRPN